MISFNKGMCEKDFAVRNQLYEEIQLGRIDIPFIPEYKSLLESHNIVVCENKLTAVYPFSLNETNKHVYFKDNDERHVYAMCAIDAIGIHYVTGRRITIRAVDEFTNESCELRVDNGEVCADYPIYVLYKNIETKAACSQRCCPFIHFFINKQNLYHYFEKNIGWIL